MRLTPFITRSVGISPIFSDPPGPRPWRFPPHVQRLHGRAEAERQQRQELVDQSAIGAQRQSLFARRGVVRGHLGGDQTWEDRWDGMVMGWFYGFVCWDAVSLLSYSAIKCYNSKN